LIQDVSLILGEMELMENTTKVPIGGVEKSHRKDQALGLQVLQTFFLSFALGGIPRRGGEESMYASQPFPMRIPDLADDRVVDLSSGEERVVIPE
jgi:hypothetical protein